MQNMLLGLTIPILIIIATSACSVYLLTGDHNQVKAEDDKNMNLEFNYEKDSVQSSDATPDPASFSS